MCGRTTSLYMTACGWRSYHLTYMHAYIETLRHPSFMWSIIIICRLWMSMWGGSPQSCHLALLRYSVAVTSRHGPRIWNHNITWVLLKICTLCLPEMDTTYEIRRSRYISNQIRHKVGWHRHALIIVFLKSINNKYKHSGGIRLDCCCT